jgi:hypothetical protein
MQMVVADFLGLRQLHPQQGFPLLCFLLELRLASFFSLQAQCFPRRIDDPELLFPLLNGLGNQSFLLH